MDFPAPSFAREWVLRGGGLNEPCVIKTVEAHGAAWWPLRKQCKDFSDFATGEPFYKRQLSRTSVLDELRRAWGDARAEVCSHKGGAKATEQDQNVAELLG